MLEGLKCIDEGHDLHDDDCILERKRSLEDFMMSSGFLLPRQMSASFSLPRQNEL